MNVLTNLQAALKQIEKNKFTSGEWTSELRKLGIVNPITFSKKLRESGFVVAADENSKEATNEYKFTYFVISEKGVAKLKQLNEIMDEDVLSLYGASL